MGAIQQEQENRLFSETENINYKVYDIDGTFLASYDEDVLYRLNEELQPINKDLVREFDKPLKSVTLKTRLNKQNILNKNGTFAQSPPEGYFTPTIGGTNGVQADTDEDVKALSCGRYFKTTLSLSSRPADWQIIALETRASQTKLKPNTDIVLTFNYYIKAASGSSWSIPIVAHVTEDAPTESDILGIPVSQSGFDYSYDGTDNNWKSFVANSFYIAQEVKTSTVNQWASATVTIPAYIPQDEDLNEYFLRVGWLKILSTSIGGLFEALYIDNVRVGNQIDIGNGAKFIKSERRQLDDNGVFTAKYEVKDLAFTNYADSEDNFTNYIDGTFKRKRDSAGKSLEQIVTQEIINDNRQYLGKYEGTLKNKEQKKVLTMSNKIHVNFGRDVHKEPVSCYIDGMKFSPKKGEYYLNIHLPNQDDDVGSVFIPEFE